MSNPTHQGLDRARSAEDTAADSLRAAVTMQAKAHALKRVHVQSCFVHGALQVRRRFKSELDQGRSPCQSPGRVIGPRQPQKQHQVGERVIVTEAGTCWELHMDAGAHGALSSLIHCIQVPSRP